MKKLIFIVVLIFPLIPYILLNIRAPYGLIWVALETFYYFPAYVVAEPLFKEAEMGLLIPSAGGRLFTLFFYTLIILIIFNIIDRVKSFISKRRAD